MNKLLIRLLSFAGIFLGLNMIIVLMVGMVIGKNDNAFLIDKSKEILILGSSSTEVALNDSIIPKAVNVSQSAETYFYSYLKLRKFLKYNSHIKTVIINYPSLTEIHDDYFSGDEFVLNKFPKYFYFMKPSEIFELFLANPNSLLRATFTIPLRYSSYFVRNISEKISYKNLNIGGFINLDRNKLVENRIIIENDQDGTYDVKFGSSDIQKKYLMEFYNLCEQNNLNLILLVTPIDSILLNRGDWQKNDYINYFNRNLSNAKLFDYSNFEIPDSCRADCEHLNHMGARIISEEVKYKVQF